MTQTIQNYKNMNKKMSLLLNQDPIINTEINLTSLFPKMKFYYKYCN